MSTSQARIKGILTFLIIASAIFAVAAYGIKETTQKLDNAPVISENPDGHSCSMDSMNSGSGQCMSEQEQLEAYVKGHSSDKDQIASSEHSCCSSGGSTPVVQAVNVDCGDNCATEGGKHLLTALLTSFGEPRESEDGVTEYPEESYKSLYNALYVDYVDQYGKPDIKAFVHMTDEDCTEECFNACTAFLVSLTEHCSEGSMTECPYSDTKMTDENARYEMFVNAVNDVLVVNSDTETDTNS
ncbi:MAG TPA: hypothetical protein VGB30_07885 [bacterium]|jgi:hypothetical protein